MATLSASEKYIATKQEKRNNAKEKRKELALKLSGTTEPSIDPMDYKLSLIKAINYYNTSADAKKLRDWIASFMNVTGRKKQYSLVSKATDFELRMLGMLCRLKMRDQYLEPHEETWIENRIQLLVETGTAKVEQKVDASKPAKADNKLNDLYSPFETAIDEVCTTKKTSFNPGDFLKGKEVSASESKQIAEYYKGMLVELKLAQTGTDEDVKEGYSHFARLHLNKLVSLVESFVAACTQRTVSAKVKKPRKAKPINPLKLTSKIKYCKEFADLNLTSIKPDKLVDSKEIWLYNTKRRLLSVIYAEPQSKLSVKGTSIIGYAIDSSKQLKLRNPETFFTAIFGSNLEEDKSKSSIRQSLTKSLKALKTKHSVPSGRINEDTILLGAF